VEPKPVDPKPVVQ